MGDSCRPRSSGGLEGLGGLRRRAGRGDGRDVDGEAGVGEQAAEASGLGGEREDLHRAGAAGAGLDVDAKGTGKQLRPRKAAASGLVWIGAVVLGARATRGVRVCAVRPRLALQAGGRGWGRRDEARTWCWTRERAAKTPK
jgi:hypothetical protein